MITVLPQAKYKHSTWWISVTSLSYPAETLYTGAFFVISVCNKYLIQKYNCLCHQFTWTQYGSYHKAFLSCSPGITDSQLLPMWSQVGWRHWEDLPYQEWYPIKPFHWDPLPHVPLTIFMTLLLNLFKEVCLALGLCNREDRHSPFHRA